ncbi:hypothetical protein P3T43_000893 [Paraburkholderia sp. GAS41]|jgi:hypothetical protein
MRSCVYQRTVRTSSLIGATASPSGSRGNTLNRAPSAPVDSIAATPSRLLDQTRIATPRPQPFPMNKARRPISHGPLTAAMPERGGVFAAPQQPHADRRRSSASPRIGKCSATIGSHLRDSPPKSLTFALAEAAKIRGLSQIAPGYGIQMLPKTLTFGRNSPLVAHPQHDRILLPKSLTYCLKCKNKQ